LTISGTLPQNGLKNFSRHKIIFEKANGLNVSLPAPLNAFLYLTGVGSKNFVQVIKEKLGIRAKGRKVGESKGAYHLREAQAAYHKERSTINIMTVKIRVFKGGEAEPERTITIPLAILKIASKLMPKQIAVSLEENGIDLNEIVELSEKSGIRGTFVEIEEHNKNKRFIIAIE